MALAAPSHPSEQFCTLLISNDFGEVKRENIKQEDLVRQLESKDDNEKIDALKQVIGLLLAGENCSKLLIPVIKFCLRSENHTIKKLLLLYWEVVDKCIPGSTKLLPEFILVCNNIRNDLNHPNEYIRGCTLRFLCKIKEAEILEPLIPAVNANLEHRHSYVRKNAVLTVFTIFQNHPELIPDAPELIEKFLLQESNLSAKRNAFLMLFHCDQDRAVNYLSSVIDQLGSLGENFQLVVFELVRKVCRTNPLAKSQYVKAIFSLVNSTSHAVAFEAANTLISLSSAPTAVRASISAYTHLLHAESDNNVKLIILNRLLGLKDKHEKLLQESLMDILRALTSPNIDIRRKTLELALDLVSARDVEEVVQFLRKELVRTENLLAGSAEVNDSLYRKLLVDTIYQCAVKFPDVAPSVVQILMTYVGGAAGEPTPAKSQPQGKGVPAPIASASIDVIYFLREIVEGYPHLRQGILKHLMESFVSIKTSKVYRVALWILGEYSTEPAILGRAIGAIENAMGPLPLVPEPVEEKKEEKEEKEKPAGDVSLRSLLLSGDYYLATVLANSYTKLVLRFAEVVGLGVPETNRKLAEGLKVLTGLLALGEHPLSEKKIDRDSRERILICVHTLLNPRPFMPVFLTKCREIFASMLEEKRKMKPSKKKATTQLVREADDLIHIRQLKAKNQFDVDDSDDADLKLAVGTTTLSDDLISRLNTVVQLTGLSDPVYAEAFVQVHEYDIILDILIINQTNETLQNMMIELTTSGDLKIVERPQTYTLGPLQQKKITANIKVSSTESGTIFGNIVYDTTTSSEKNVVVMNSIHMDIMDYINPASTSDNQFRAMWAEFEWENKVSVNTDITELEPYLQHIANITNMRVLTPPSSLSGQCGFLAANLYATSIFGEDALLNLSIEKQPNGPIVGFIRIRSKTQGIALSLGDKVQAKQRLPFDPSLKAGRSV